MTGSVVAIHVASQEGGPVQTLPRADLVAGRGIGGDRYGGDDNSADPARQVTLVESEAVEAANREHGLALTPADTRRNIATRGVSLNDLVGVTFTVGGATLRGVELCEPCRYLAGLLDEPRVVKALARRGGLNAEILSGGPVAVGDPVRPAQRAAGRGHT